MKHAQRRIILVRHGETAWSLSGQHTGLTDIPLTDKGKADAQLLTKRLKEYHFEQVFTSPLIRARETCEISGLFKHAKIEPTLVEWNYGKYEGMTTPQIWKEDPNWNLFFKGAPGGESLADVTARANHLLIQFQAYQGDIALFSHGHFLRVLIACWLQLSANQGKCFLLAPSSVSILTLERKIPVLGLLNDTSHLNSH